MMREKFNFTGKNDNEEITHEFFESTTISKSLTQKSNKHIDKKAHNIHLKIQVVILAHPMVWVHSLKQDPNTIDR